MKHTLGAAMLLFACASASWADCREVGLKEFRAATRQQAGRVVFFASWCSSCAQHITVDRLGDTIFVATSDSKAKADKVLQYYLRDKASRARCFVDQDESIAKAFGLKNLPAERLLSDLGPDGS